MDESENINSPKPSDDSLKIQSEEMDKVEEELVEYSREAAYEVPDVCEDVAAQHGPNSPSQSENHDETQQEVPVNYAEPDDSQSIQQVPDVIIPFEDIAAENYAVYLEDPDQGIIQDTDMYLHFFRLLDQYQCQNVPSFYWELPPEE